MDTTDKPAVKSSKDTEVPDDSTSDNKNDDTTRNKTKSADVSCLTTLAIRKLMLAN